MLTFLKQSSLGIVSTQPREYMESLAWSLCLYAKDNPYFAQKLKHLLAELPQLDFVQAELPLKLSGRTEEYLRILLPTSTENALRRARWLLGRLAEREEMFRLLPLLSCWSRETKEDPKIIVIGMVLGVVPPIGAGHIERKKKMSFIVRHDVVAKGSVWFGSAATHAALDILARAVQMAGGNIQKLEPEMGDWFFGEREICFYQTNKKMLLQIKKELNETSILHEATEEKGEIAIIAITPSADAVCQELRWGLTPLVF